MCFGGPPRRSFGGPMMGPRMGARPVTVVHHHHHGGGRVGMGPGGWGGGGRRAYGGMGGMGGGRRYGGVMALPEASTDSSSSSNSSSSVTAFPRHPASNNFHNHNPAPGSLLHDQFLAYALVTRSTLRPSSSVSSPILPTPLRPRFPNAPLATTSRPNVVPLRYLPDMTSVGSHAADSHDAASTALRGASLAFQKKKPAPPPPKKDNGALTAATSAGQSSTSRSPARSLVAQSTGGGNGHLAPPNMSQPSQFSQTPVSGERLLPTRPVGPGSSPASTVKVDTKSPSYIAATLAASRSASPTPKSRGPSKTQSPAVMKSASPAEVVDSMPIAPTGSLISMFERGGLEGDPVKQKSPKRSPTRVGRTSIDETRRPKPESRPEPTAQASTPLVPKPAPPAMKENTDQRTTQANGAALGKPRPAPKPRPLTPPTIISRSSPELVSPKPRRLMKTSLPSVASKPTPPPVADKPLISEPPAPKMARATKPSLPAASPKTLPQEAGRRSPQQSHPSKKEVPQTPRPPTPPKPRRSKTNGTGELDNTRKHDADSGGYFRPPHDAIRRPSLADRRPRSAHSNSSDDTFVSASSAQSPSRPSPPVLPTRRRTIASAPSSPVRETPPRLTPRPMRHANASTSTLPLESLTTAIVAGSLASANLTPHHTGSTLPLPPLPKRQKSPHLLQTLRQPHVASDDESDRHKKSHLRKLRGGNKHSHHEGSRKRWREEITPRERKRYEAVWASNRGRLLNPQHGIGDGSKPPLDTTQYVINIVVREVWKRSRLPDDELAEVWDLVDRQRLGMLSRQEFVVGMWLIDQRLRGRKIPHRVSESVWGSANGLHVYKPKAKR
ncbi:increased rDNA silencing IRS4 [Paramyrothecium foliicola]|nr:increased rDNA silencing IRS4 [Paramyrothecium foliicola]